MIGVNLNVPFGSNVFHQAQSGSSSLIKYDSPQTFINIKIQMRDKRHRVLDTHGSDWSIVFKAYYLPY